MQKEESGCLLLSPLESLLMAPTQKQHHAFCTLYKRIYQLDLSSSILNSFEHLQQMLMVSENVLKSNKTYNILLHAHVCVDREMNPEQNKKKNLLFSTSQCCLYFRNCFKQQTDLRLYHELYVS